MAEPDSRLRGPNPFEQERIAARYESWYAGAGGRADRLERRLLVALLREVPGARSLLEVGCGTGHFTCGFRDLGLRVTGLDRSMAMLARARDRSALSLVRGDAVSLPFPDAAFDVVALVTAVAFLAEPGRALEEAFRVARRGVLLGEIDAGSRLGRKLQRKGGPIWSAARLVSRAELRELALAAAGERRPRIVERATLRPRGLGWLAGIRGGFAGLAAVIERGGSRGGAT